MIMSTSTNVKVAVATMLVLACASLVSCRNETVITAGQLPEAAQNFLREYFPESPVSYVKKEKELMGSTIEAVLQDGTEIDFDSKGEWDNVDCKSAAVPAAIVPSAVAGHVQANFPGQSISKIDREHYGFEVELAGGLELRFDKDGKFIRIDD